MKYRPELRVISAETPFLDFIYHSPKMSAPSLVINGLGYYRGSADWGLFYQIDNESEIVELIFELFPELSFIEFCELTRKTSLTPTNLQKLAQSYQWNPSESFWAFVDETKNFPAAFKTWMHSKKIQISDIASYRSLKTAPATEALNFETIFWQLTSIFAEKDLNKQFGIKIFELLIELLLMGEDIENLRASPQGHLENFRPEDWYERLRLLRYPETTRRFELQKSYWTELPWPKFLHPKFIRQNDRVGIEIKTLIPHAEDLKKTIAGLQLVQKELERKSLVGSLND